MKELQMRNLLALIGAVVVIGGGVGWYMGWYKLSVTRESDGNLQIKTDWDTNKATKDVTEGLKNLSTAVENHKANDANTAPPAGTPGATPGPVAPAQSSPFNPLAPQTPELPKIPNGVTVTPPNGKIQLISPK
jgi:hypothetical protein